MADGYGMGMGGGDLFRSSIMRQGLEDTPYPQQAISGMLGGATPEQIQSFFQSPQVQEQFRSFGIDPQAMLSGMRQSPFLPNSFMQGHPRLGGAISGALANVAATPEAPLVSGAGSGISRAAQGMFGGPEMLRQYQLHQMTAPFGALGAMMPTFGEQRRRAIEEAIVKETGQRMQAFPEAIKAQEEERTRDRVTSTPWGPWVEHYTPGTPETGAGIMPDEQARPGQWSGSLQYFDPKQVSGIAEAKQTEAQKRFLAGKASLQEAHANFFDAMVDAKVPEAQARLASARAAEAYFHANGGKSGEGWSHDKASKLEEWKLARKLEISKQFIGVLAQYGGKIDPKTGEVSIDERRWKSDDPDTYGAYWQEMQLIEDGYSAAGNAMAPGQYPVYQYLTRGIHSNLGPQSPAATGSMPPNSPMAGTSPGTAQAGGAGAASSQTTAAAPPASDPGLPPGQFFDENGIPRQRPPAQAAPSAVPAQVAPPAPPRP